MPLYCSQRHENPVGNRFCHYCGEQLPLSTNHAISQGMMLGDRYLIVSELGSGGFGRTYMAQDSNRFNEPCVLKEFAPQVQSSYALQKSEELFEREASVLYKLQHSQIPKFRELFKFNEEGKRRLFLVQDYVDGETYRSLLEGRQSHGQCFAEDEVMQMLRQILPVLEYIHSLGVIHRDISPDNLMLRRADGMPILIDFGGVKQIAASVESQFQQNGMADEIPAMSTRLGKAGYAPEEQIQKGVVLPHSDLYALAATALVLLTGKEPPELINSQTLVWEWRQKVNLSPTLGTVLDKMLSHRTSDRYQSAREVLQALHSTNEAIAPQSLITHFPSPIFDIAGKILLALLITAGAGSLGWWGGNLWVQSQSETSSQEKPIPASFPPIDTEPTPSPQFSATEQTRKQQLRDRRNQLFIDYKFYSELADQIFWAQNPNLPQRKLTNETQDEQLREQWDKVARQLLDKLEQANLSPEARRRLGRYSYKDREGWKTEVNQLHLSSRALNDLVDGTYVYLFPDYSAQTMNLRFDDFLDKPIGQIWQAIAADQVKALQSGLALEEIFFGPGIISQRVKGTLKPGEGKAYVAHLTAKQMMELDLQAAEKVLFSIYSPTGGNKILQNSRDRRWLGTLPESGYYEIVIVSDSSTPINYELNLRSDTPVLIPSPESPTPSP